MKGALTPVNTLIQRHSGVLPDQNCSDQTMNRPKTEPSTRGKSMGSSSGLGRTCSYGCVLPASPRRRQRYLYLHRLDEVGLLRAWNSRTHILVIKPSRNLCANEPAALAKEVMVLPPYPSRPVSHAKNDTRELVRQEASTHRNGH